MKPCRRALFLVMAVLCLLGPQETWAATDYDPPKLDWTALDLDALSLTASQRSEIAGALGALASNFPGDATIDTDLREKALALALTLDPYDGTARLAHESLSTGGSPQIVEGYGSRNLVAGVLWNHAARLAAPAAEPEDHKLAPLLMELALIAYLKPETEQIALYAKAAQQFPPAWDRYVVVGATRGESDRRLGALRRLLERAAESNPPAAQTPVTPAMTVSVPPTPETSGASVVVPPDAPPATSVPPVVPVMSATTPEPRSQRSSTVRQDVKQPMSIARLRLLTGGRSIAANGSISYRPEVVELALEPRPQKPLVPSVSLDDPPPRSYGVFSIDPGPRPFSARAMLDASDYLETRWKLPPDERLRVSMTRHQSSSESLRSELSAAFNSTVRSGDDYVPVTLGLVVGAEAAFQSVELDSTAVLGGTFEELSGGMSISEPVRFSQVLGQVAAVGGKVLVTPAHFLMRREAPLMLAAARVDEVLAVQTLTVATMEDVAKCMAAKRAPELEQALSLFSDIQALRTRMTGEDIVRNVKVQERLQQILTLAPNHFTASILLDYGRNGSGSVLTAENSRYQLGDLFLNLDAVLVKETESPGTVLETEGLALVNTAAASLRLMKPRLAPEAQELARTAETALKNVDAFFRIKNRDTANASQKRSEAVSLVKSVVGNGF